MNRKYLLLVVIIIHFFVDLFNKACKSIEVVIVEATATSKVTQVHLRATSFQYQAIQSSAVLDPRNRPAGNGLEFAAEKAKGAFFGSS